MELLSAAYLLCANSVLYICQCSMSHNHIPGIYHDNISLWMHMISFDPSMESSICIMRISPHNEYGFFDITEATGSAFTL